MRTRSLQRGATLIVMATVLVLGFAWFTVGALGKNAVTTAEREAKTAAALQSAKKALLGHVAHYAALTTGTGFQFPGRMPCPESLSAYGNPLTEGVATGACSNTSAEFGRLPWRTLGIGQLRDGDGEPLWYVLSPNFHPVSFPLNPAPPNPYLNFGTLAALPFDGANVVAVIIAPGRALQSNPCNAVNQQVSRYATPLQPNKFFECGNATGSYTNPGSGTGSNDRVLAITKAEWIAAIAGPVADRVQRQVAPALIDWRANEGNTNWGELFLPYASTFSDPGANSLCGSYNVREGLMPLATAATSDCTHWTGGSITQLAGVLGSTSCAQVGGSYECRFINLSATASLTVRISARAPSVGGSFRGRITAASISGYQAQGGVLSNFSLALSNTDGDADLSFRLSFPLLSVGQEIIVTIPNLPDAALLSAPGMRWFVGNEWARHTYYAISHGVKLEPTGLTCNPPDYDDCLELNGVARQRFIVALMGLPLATQSRSCATDTDSDGIIDCNDRSQYIESRTSSNIWHQDRIDAVFNDRVATCPFEVAPASGTAVPLC